MGYDEAVARLAEAQKAKSQADQVVAEINASIAKDQKEFEATLKEQTANTLKSQAAAAEKALSNLEATADAQVEAFIQKQAVTRGVRDLTRLTKDQQSKFMDLAIGSL